MADKCIFIEQRGNEATVSAFIPFLSTMRVAGDEDDAMRTARELQATYTNLSIVFDEVDSETRRKQYGVELQAIKLDETRKRRRFLSDETRRPSTGLVGTSEQSEARRWKTVAGVERYLRERGLLARHEYRIVTLY